MTIANAIKKLNKAGFAVTENCGFRAAKSGAKLIEFYRNGREGDVTCIRVRRAGDQDDSMTDYCAGVFVDTITAAIKRATA